MQGHRQTAVTMGILQQRATAASRSGLGARGEARVQDAEWFGLLQMRALTLCLLFLEPTDGVGRS